jgi:hypothetical protein
MTPTALAPSVRSLARFGPAVVLALALLTGCADDTTPQRGDIASDSDAARELAQQRTEPTAVPHPKRTTVTAPGPGGRSYRCPLSIAARIDAADAKVKRRKSVLKGRRAALRKIQRRYPGGTAPSAVVDRYEFLRARYNAQVRLVNKAVRAHNRLLRQVCRPD